MRIRLAIFAAVLTFASSSGYLRAQQTAPLAMGSVAMQDALVTGGLEVQGSQVRLMSNVSVTAHDRTAAVALERGGEVLVCATSEFHLLHSGIGKSLLFGLDRGAIELHTVSESQDVILTPDLRFTVEAKGSYDLQLRVARGGDTCVENTGQGAPVLMLHDAFSSASYRVMPGQHVLFEHGSLSEVVDNERSECGCPSATELVVLAANASAVEKAQAEHPFPVAASEGLAVITPDPRKPVSGAPATETFSYKPKTAAPGNSGMAAPGSPGTALPAKAEPHAPPPVPATEMVSTVPPATPPGAHDIAHKIGRFFHRLFHPNS